MHTHDVRAAARALGGDTVGRDQVLCPGPGHSPRDRSLAVRFVADGFIVHSHANDDWQTCRDHVSARLGLDSQQPVTKPAHVRATPQPPDDAVDRIGWARSLWRTTVPAKGTLAERYLVETRRLELPDSAAIRFHPRLKFSRISEFLPAMVCAMVDTPSGLPVSSNRCYEPNTKSVKLTLAGTRVDYRVAEGRKDKIILADAINDGPANFVHSMDATHLVLSVNAAAEEGISDVAVVHDCYGAPAPQVQRFQQIIRREMALMYHCFDVLGCLRDGCGPLIGHTLPETGKLNLLEIQAAEYPFT